ncbi:SAM-dependent methyltransferase [Pseudomarimonas arenosa]|uniref:SAM-dependent methyltransferase n=1 Tax=Pseudomarimonas arenosa TaxID=2774145 RepID=A0AAW3ZM71_9GAMM|nr:SAM-dependent methyltransferase [Pseudomarimonas arenosa]MBD8526269.1 SAM-dependent methyltransferase [Pseudomarimonas arenosa]
MDSSPARPAQPIGLLLSVACIAAAALAYQIVLMRFYAVLHWQWFAAMIVSLALLGHGLSGSLLALRSAAFGRCFDWLYPWLAVAFALSMPLAFAIAQRWPFNGLELIWDPAQLAWLALSYLCLSLPFACAAACFGLAFIRYGAAIPRLYAADLFGAGLGALGVLWLMQALPLRHWLPALGLLAVFGAWLGSAGLSIARRSSLLALGLLLLPPSWTAVEPNPYKGLSATLRLPGAERLERQAGPLGVLDLLASPEVPLRQVAGLSMLADREPVAQLGLFIDGEGPSPISQVVDVDRLGYLEQTTAALPYQLLSAPSVLILGAGGGDAGWQALRGGARSLQLVEPNAQLAAWLDTPGSPAYSALIADLRVQRRVADPRAVLDRAERRYDLIVLPPPDSPIGAGGGVQAASDTFLYTIEALRSAWHGLQPNGMISISRWEQSPPRASLKLIATAVAALRDLGVSDPAAHLLLIRDWQTSVLLIGRRPFSAEQQAAAQSFCRRYAFETVHLAGLDLSDLQSNDRLREAVRAVLGADAERFIAEYAFDIRPAKDERPFFHNYFRWQTLPVLWRLRAQGGATLLDSGYLLVLAGLVQASLLAALLILLPLRWLPRAARASTSALRRWPAAAYFFALGLGFLFFEIAALSRYTLYLGQPLWSASLVLAGLLGFAGVGSATAQRWTTRPMARRIAALSAAVAILAFEWLHPAWFALSANWPVWARALSGGLLLAPCAFLLGLPFPLGLSRLATHAPALVPWAWGINGVASVISALLAVVLAMAWGYSVIMLIAAGLYVLAAWSRF